MTKNNHMELTHVSDDSRLGTADSEDNRCTARLRW